MNYSYFFCLRVSLNKISVDVTGNNRTYNHEIMIPHKRSMGVQCMNLFSFTPNLNCAAISINQGPFMKMYLL